jgi:hypothetical protein
MIRILVLLLTISAFNIAQAQDRAFTISYGDVTSDVEDTSVEATGWRVDLLFEHQAGKLTHGFGIGYIETKADYTSAAQTTNYKLKSLPFYYAPKFLLGKKAFKGFIKGAIGLQFSEFTRSGALGDLTADDAGLYAGVSLGVRFNFNPKVFMNLEYEWDYLSDSYYKDDYTESIILGIGFKT